MVDPPRLAPATTFQNENGKDISLASFQGKTVLVNLWATWCPPCVKEMPSLDRLNKALGGPKFAVVALSQDHTLAMAKTFLVKHHLDQLGSYLDENGKVGRALGAQGLPTTYILNDKGRIIASMEGGAEWDSPEMIARLKALTSQSTSKE